MNILPVLVLATFCLFANVSSDKGASCTYNGKVYDDGETIVDSCQICECDNGQVKDCSFNVNCREKKAPLPKEDITDVSYEDDPDVIETSDPKASNRVKRALGLGNLLKLPVKQEVKVNTNQEAQNKVAVTSKSSVVEKAGIEQNAKGPLDLNGKFHLGGVQLNLGAGLGHGKKDINTSSEEEKTINGGEGKGLLGFNSNLHLGGANLNLGAGLGHGPVVTSSEEKKTIIGGEVNGGLGGNGLLGLNSNIHLGGANLNLGAGLTHGPVVTSSEEKKTLIGGEVNGGVGGNGLLGLNGNVHLGGANLNLGAGLGHGHVVTSSEEKKTIIGGEVNGGVGGNGLLGLNSNIHLGGANLNLGAGLSHGPVVTSSEEKKTLIGGEVNGGVGGNGLLGLNGNVHLGGANLNLGAGLGHGHVVTSSEEKKTIIGGEVNGGVGGNGLLGLNSNIHLGGVNLNLGAGLGHGPVVTSSEEKKTIIGGEVNGGVGGNGLLGLNGNVHLGGANMNLGAGLGHGHVVTSSEEKKTIIGGEVNGGLGGKGPLDLNGKFHLGGVQLNLGAGLGHGKKDIDTSSEEEKTINGGEGKGLLGFNSNLHLGGANLNLGAGLGHGHVVTSSEEKKTIIGGEVNGGVGGNGLLGFNGNVHLGGANLNLGAGLGHGHVVTSSEEKKTIVGGEVNGGLGGKGLLGLNGNLHLGGAHLNLGAGLGHGKKDTDTSSEEEKAINGGEGKGPLDLNGKFHLGGVHLNLGAGLGHGKKDIDTSSEEKTINGGEGKGLLGLNGNVHLGGANLNLGAGLGHGHVVTSSEEKKTIGGEVNGGLGGNGLLGLNGNLHLGGAHLNLGAGLGHGKKDIDTSSEEQKTINGGEGKGLLGLNGNLHLGGAHLNLGAGLGHGKKDIDTSNEEEKTVIGGEVNGGVGGKGPLDLNGKFHLGGVQLNLGAGLGHGKKDIDTSSEEEKTINGGEGKGLLGFNSNLHLGGANLNLGAGLGHGHVVTSSEEKKTIIGGEVNGGVGGNGLLGFNGNVHLGGANLNLGAGLGHGHVVTSSEEKKTIVGGEVNGGLGGKGLLGLNGNLHLGGAHLNLGAGLGHGKKDIDTSSEEQKTINGGEGKGLLGSNGNLHLGGAHLNLGAGLGHGKKDIDTSSEEEKTINGGEGKGLLGLNGNVHLGGANLNLGAGLGHGHVVTNSEEKKTIIGGEVNGGVGGNSLLGLNGNLHLGGAHLNLGAGLGHGKKDVDTSSEEEKTVIGGEVNGGLGGKGPLGLNGKFHLGGGHLNLGAGLGHGKKDVDTSSEEEKTVIGGEVNGGLGGKGLLGLNGNLHLGGAHLNLGAGLGHGKKDIDTSNEEEKTIIGGEVNGGVGGKGPLGLNGKFHLGGVHLNLGAGLGHGKKDIDTSSEEEKTINGGEGKGPLDLNGKFHLGGGHLNLGAGLGHGKKDVDTSSEEEKTVIGGEVNGGLGGKGLLGLNGNLHLGGAHLNLGAGLGHGKKDVDTSSEEEKTVIGGEVNGGLGGKGPLDLNGKFHLGGVHLNLGAGLGHGKKDIDTSSEEEKTINGGQGKGLLGLNGNVHLGGANLNLGAGLGHGHVVTNSEEKKTIIGGEVNGGVGGNSLLGLNGNLHLGGAHLNLGAGLGHGKKDVDTSSEEEKTVIGGEVNGGLGGKGPLGLNGKFHLGGGHLNLGAGLGHGKKDVDTSSEEEKTVIGGEVNGGLGGKGLLGLNGNLHLGGAHLNLGAGLGHGKKDIDTSSEEEKTIIGGEVNGGLGDIHKGSHLEVNGITGHAHGLRENKKFKGKFNKTKLNKKTSSEEEQEDSSEEEKDEENTNTVVVPTQSLVTINEPIVIAEKVPLLYNDNHQIVTEQVKNNPTVELPEEPLVVATAEVPEEKPAVNPEVNPSVTQEVTHVDNPTVELPEEPVVVATAEVAEEKPAVNPEVNPSVTQEVTHVDNPTVELPEEPVVVATAEVPEEKPAVNPEVNPSVTQEVTYVDNPTVELPEEPVAVATAEVPEEKPAVIPEVNPSVTQEVTPKELVNKEPNVEETNIAPTSSPEESEAQDCIFNKESVADGQSVKLDCVTCMCIKGSLFCIKDLACPGVCSVTGYQTIRTFDGTLYEHPGTCSYVLVKTSGFTVTLNNKPCAELGNGVKNPDAVCIDSVDIYIPLVASLTLYSNGTISSTSGQVELPFIVHDTLTVLRSSSTFLDVASSFFNLQYDFKGNRLYVILESNYKGQTSGLCGTYNDNRNDDYRSSLDMTETVSGLFSKSWRIQPQCMESVQRQEDSEKRVQADLTCSGAFDDSIFEDCRLLIDTHSYKTSCANSVYYGDMQGFCSAMADYAYQCARAGVFVPISSTFADCAVSCDGDMITTTDTVFTQQDCAEHSSVLRTISSSIPLSEACICPPDLYYDATLNLCVKSDDCPCYVNNKAYKLGETIHFSNGESCPCERILQCGETDEFKNIDEVEKCSEDEIFSDCSMGHGKSCEPSCQNVAIIDQVCNRECIPGCVCKHGLLRSSDGSCIPLNECPCVHGDDVYNPGETLARDCNTCTCENGKFTCTNNVCNAVCNAYAGSQFFLFDNVWKTFPTFDCPIVLVESQEHIVPQFRVTMQNVPSEAIGGALAKKQISITFGGVHVVLSDSDPFVAYDLGSTTQVKIYRSGFYVVAHFLEGLAVYYDQHLDVIIQLEPRLQGKVQGMCGDADGKTTTELAISNMEQYGSQYLIGTCPAPELPLPTPTDKHRNFVEKRCNLLKSEIFAACHDVVNVQPYYTACVEETENCRDGESCLCFCTSLAAYARACCRKGVTIEWRSPDTCPSPCEYYNRASGEGPYHLLMMNGKSLVADFESKTVSVAHIDSPGNLQASFMVTPSLFIDALNGRRLISLESAEHPNYFIVQNDDGSLSLKKWQPIASFRSQATFVLRTGRWVKGFEALESYTSRGHYLSINNDKVIMSRVKSGSMLEMNFQLIEESFGLPSFSICTWKYRSCGNPCIPTCADPLGAKCTLTLKVEGCYPICAPGMVFDETTHRCVRFEDCVTIEVTPSTTVEPSTVSPTVIPTNPEEPCKNVVCEVVDCKEGYSRVEVPSSDPCCPDYECIEPSKPTTTTVPSTSPLEPCKNVVCEVLDCKEGYNRVEVPTTNLCCPQYECIEPPKPTTTIVPSTSPLETCKNIVCEVVDCKEGYNRVEVPSADACCPQYECIEPVATTTSAPSTSPLEPCKNVHCKVLDCADGENRVETSSADPCCPRYECIAPTTTATTTVEPCKNVLCESVTCQKGETLVEVPWPDPCCPHYVCEPEPTTTLEPTTPPSHCQDAKCPLPSCEPSELVLVKVNPGDPCCAAYECVPPTPPPTIPQPTTPKDECKDVICEVDVCLKIGSVPEEIESDDPCCPHYSCECGPCAPPPFCNGNKAIMKIDPEAECCPRYECPPEQQLKATTTPVPTTTEEPCKNILCEAITCTKKGESMVVLPWSDACCPLYKCECEKACVPPPACENGKPPIRLYDAESQCCPDYECQPDTTTPSVPVTTLDQCKDVVCTTKTCKDSEIPVLDVGRNPCCTEYICVPLVVPTTPAILNPTTPSNPCENVKCDREPSCNPEDNVLVSFDPVNTCCPLYKCIPPTPTTVPPPPTTPQDICKDVVCEVNVCLKEGSISKQVPSDDPCCPKHICECSPCDPVPSCNGNRAVMSIDPETQCCPKYECLPEPETTTPPITTPQDVCKNILCDFITCERKGATPVEVPWADQCCPRFECRCEKECSPPPICENGKAPVGVFNTATNCCPEYECPSDVTTTTVSPITPPDICKDIVCTTKTCNEPDVLVAIVGNNPCCFDYTCVPPIQTTTTTPVPPTTLPCQNARCDPTPECFPEETLLVKSDPEDPCCPLYDCVPPVTTTVLPSTTPKDECRDIVCHVIDCVMEGSFLKPVGGNDPCCPEYTCECRPCAPAPYCNGNKAIMKIDPETQCCPTYECPPEQRWETTTPYPQSTTTKVDCSIVTCNKDVECKPSEIEIHEFNPDDPCCPLYYCVPGTTLAPPVITTVPITTIISSTKIDCKNRICKPKTCKDTERLVVTNNPLDPCCPLYTCQCECKTIPACSRDERLVAVPQYNQCCPKLKCERKRDDCNPVATEVTLTSGKCSAPVILSTCSGYCHSKTEYDSLWTPVPHCRCCSATSTRPKNFELPCPDGSIARLTVLEAQQCRCNRCSETDGSGYGSGSGSGSGDDASGYQLWSNFEGN